MPLPNKNSKNCMGETIKTEMAAGKPRKQAIAIAISHCGKSKDKKMELSLVKELILEEKKDLHFIRTELEKKKKWLQKASKSIEKKGSSGDFTSWCKKHGYGGVSQTCINAAAKAGGHAAKMALFAANASKGKYSYPKNKKK